MENERTRDHENSSGKPEGDQSHERGRGVDEFLLQIAMLVLLAATAPIAIGMPQALEIAANHANAAAVNFTNPEPTDRGDRALEDAEEESGPLIFDDLRTEGVMLALANVPGAISSR